MIGIELQRTPRRIAKDETTAVPCSQEKGRNCVAAERVSH